MTPAADSSAGRPDAALVGDLTLEQQVSLTGGADFLSTHAVGDVPSVTLVDGPAGLRMQDLDAGADHLGLRPSIPATAFPLPVAVAQTWDSALVRRLGEALGTEAQAAGVGVLLGPGINIKRDPRAGRNFEYFSEDPLLTGVLATSYVQGLQSRGVGASLKHFAANNAEHERFRSSSDVDPRPLREIYLRAFQRVVQEARPWSVMCSYNRLNGVPNSENRWLLTRVLREEWQFEGAVISDWGAVDDRVVSIRAGLDLDMPAGSGRQEALVRSAVEHGELTAADLEDAAGRVARLAATAATAARPDTVWDQAEHHALAREIAGRSIVLLKNDQGTLPLRPDARVALLGDFAVEPRFQAGGSSHVWATRVDVPADELASALPDAHIVVERTTVAEADGNGAAARTRGLEAARDADVAVVFIGPTGAEEAEGFDRDHIELSDEHVALVRDVAAVQPRTVAVVMHGGLVRLAPVVPFAAAIVDASLLGQAAGGAVADVLTGAVNPSGRIAETVPERLEDAPSYLDFPGTALHVRYGEGIFVGYRGYDARGLAVTFPFGHGLSYTTFGYSGLRVTTTASGDLDLDLTVVNTGTRAGREIVQAYVGLSTSTVPRAPRELMAFSPVELDAGESADVTMTIGRQDLAFWDVGIDGWRVEGGDYTVSVGSSSRDLRVTVAVRVVGDDVSRPLTLSSSLAEVLADPVAGQVFGTVLAAMFPAPESDARSSDTGGFDIVRMIGSTPVGRFVSSLGDRMTREQAEAILEEANSGRVTTGSS
ncbi:glycoside hydrolase family 3 C-terminal domain-containing protein [Frigoribacterium sp. PhB24]|uniref:beta-glucosidase n=1 Tax=Frigoribacterium sp. PhB24 TaxID=2485204 RepID=UPI000F47BDFB|nr:glycoside hydrolase family 3 C-terminal domain-containing protein [Frigoribacterium sp. PhB24]ROS48910.1 beta-glucosidase [Frigoribacterium sp. PhB24]